MKRFWMLMAMTAAFAWTMPALPAMAQEGQSGEKKSGEKSTAEKAKERSRSVAEKASRATSRTIKKGVDATKKGAKTGVAAVAGAVEGTKEGSVEGWTGTGAAPGAAALNALSPGEKEDGWELLFNGRDLTGFQGFKAKDASASWKVTDGTIAYAGGSRALPLSSNPGTDLVSEREFGSFELVFDWKLSPGGNSGVMYQVTEEGDETYWSGPEYQILDNDGHPDAKQGSNGNRTAAACYDLYAPSTDATKAVGEWNVSKIVMRGNHVEHWLNGAKVVEYERDSEDWNQRIEASKFKQWPMFAAASRGHIVFQDHGDDVWYRNIKVRELE